MNIPKNWLMYCLVVVLIFLYGSALAFGLSRLDHWRANKSKEYLSEAKTTDDVTRRLFLAEQSLALRQGEDAFLVAGTAAVQLGQNTLGEKYLSRVKSGRGLLELGKAHLKLGWLVEARESLSAASALLGTEESSQLLYLAGGVGEYPDVSRETNAGKRIELVYNELLARGYPQAAILRLQADATKSEISRDALIKLGMWQMSVGKEDDAYSTLIKAKTEDRYYPQVYQQLVQVCERLNKLEEAKTYKTLLSSLAI